MLRLEVLVEAKAECQTFPHPSASDQNQRGFPVVSSPILPRLVHPSMSVSQSASPAQVPRPDPGPRHSSVPARFLFLSTFVGEILIHYNPLGTH